MASEKPGDCSFTACGGTCGPGQVETYKVPDACSGGNFQRRCCTASSYPDVMVMVDKGQGSTLTWRYYGSAPNMQYADYNLLETTWTSAKTVKALPGRQPSSSSPGSWLEISCFLWCAGSRSGPVLYIPEQPTGERAM